MSAVSIPASRARFLGIFIIALVGVAYQVLLTRIFSVTLYYHFAFAGISLAMLGLTVGAEKVYLNAKRFSADRFEEEWAHAALKFSTTSIEIVLWFLCAPLILPKGLILAVLSCSLLLFVIPFTYSGICVTLILTRSASVGQLYAADLIGAALGCVGIVALLFYLDPVCIVFLLSGLSAYAAFKVAGTHLKLAARAKKIMLFMVAVGVVQGALYVTDHPHLGVFWAKGTKQQSILFERWNAFSRVRVIPWASEELLGWGFGRRQTMKIDQKYLDIDADAGTILTHFDGTNLKPVSYLEDDVINMGYHLRPIQSVAVIGVGGGRDVMSALYFGAKKIVAIELNPAIVEAITTKFADFTGHFVSRPEVTLINAEARSWLAQHRPQVDMVQISLIDTWAATAAGGLALSENRLYTMEAWKEFMGTLTPNGMLVVSRWFKPTNYKGEFYRLLSLAASSLEARGVPRSELRQHILAFNGHEVITVAVSPSAFTPAEVTHAHEQAKKWNFNVEMAPDTAFDDTSRIIASGEADKAFYDSLPIDVSTPTDNSPFFFFMTRLRDALHPRSVTGYDTTNSSALTVVVILMLGTLVVTAGFVLDPLLKMESRVPLKGVLLDLTYFGGIGLGFMLIEISQMQRLMVFLGHPIYGLCVVLFTLLLFGGLGSATVHEDIRPERIWKRPFLLCIVLCAVGFMTAPLMTEFTPFGTPARILVSIVLLAPAGFCMGMMFPTGMVISARNREMQPWFWGINGAVSVFASILGMAISIVYGIAAAYWTGVAAYAVCLLIVLSYKPQDARGTQG